MNKRTIVRYNVRYQMYYNSGGSLLASLTANTLIDLKKKMRDTVSDGRKYDINVVTFQPIEKVVTTSAAKGKYVQFGRITHPFLGKNPSMSKYYNKVTL